MQVNVQYSSTCPQSKALSEFVLLKSLKDCLLRPGNTAQPVDLEEVLKFIEERGLPATPHAQRSKLTLWGELLLDQGSISLLDWLKEVIEELEFELKTPVQTWVKKADEMAFAEQNAKHTKFCEDAARTILTWFRRAEGSAAQLKKIRGKVIHFESLHPFNAVARFAAKS
jgi:GTP cyclohydrolase I